MCCWVELTKNLYIVGDEREFDELAKDLGVKVDVLEPDDFFDLLRSLVDTNSTMNEYIRQILEYEDDRRRILEEPPAFYMPFLQGKKDITWSKKLAHFIPDIYPSMIIPSWDILRRDLTLAKKSGVFDKYRIKYTD